MRSNDDNDDDSFQSGNYKNTSVNNNDNFPSVKDIENARKVLKTYNINKTPLQKSNTFSKIIGSNLYLKNESLQATGTFKIRGALYKIDKIIKEHQIKSNEFNIPSSIHDKSIDNDGNNDKDKIGIIAASAGNHAQGVALASKMNNLPYCI